MGRVAVVVPVFDEARLVGSLVPALDHLAVDAEVVVVDGGSRDGTREALARFRLIDAPRGRATQMNAGARATAAPVLLFLHADTRLPPTGLDAVAAAIDSGAVAGCFQLRIDSQDPRLRLASSIINLRSRLLPSASGDQGIFVRRDVFDAIGGYRPIALCEDLDLVARLAPRGRFACLNETVETSARRWQRNGVNRTIALMWALRLGYHLGVAPATLQRLYGEAR
jgi:rSAM/selenodomain-associated transferase 2